MVHTIFQLCFALLSSLVALAFSLWASRRFLLKKLNWTPDSQGHDIAVAGTTLSVGWLLSGMLAPAQKLTPLIGNQQVLGSLPYVLQHLLYLTLFLLLGLLLASISALLGLRLFLLFKLGKAPKDEEDMEEKEENNLAKAFLLSVLLLVMSIFLREAYAGLLDAFLPYPDWRGGFE